MTVDSQLLWSSESDRLSLWNGEEKVKAATIHLPLVYADVTIVVQNELVGTSH